MLFTEITLRYYHPRLNIGMANLKSIWLLEPEPVQILATVYRGALIYRMPGSRKRISYRMLKKGLVKTTRIIKQPLHLLPF